MRDWTKEETERLDGYMDQARLKVNAKRMLPGVPTLVSINNGGDRRRKRKMSWAVMAAGKPKDSEKVRFHCAGKEVVDVSREEVQPIQVCERVRANASACVLVLSCAAVLVGRRSLTLSPRLGPVFVVFLHKKFNTRYHSLPHKRLFLAVHAAHESR